MATIIRKTEYRCPNDECFQGGCEKHTATLKFQSVSEYYTFDDGQDTVLSFNKEKLQALVDCLRSVDRADSVKFDNNLDDIDYA